MQPIDREILSASALVIDANPTSRSLLATQLRDFGVGTVVQANRIHEARRTLESRVFDIVLCEQDFEAEGYSGQNLLDDLRRLQLLPLSTAFIIISGAASTTTVVDAAESAVDSFLLKPYTAATLGERLAQVRKRKKALADIHAPVAAGDLAAAARLCVKRFKEQGPFHAHAARLGCELLLRLGEPEAARRLNEMVLEGRPNLPWARLGIARAQIQAQQPGLAARNLEALVADHPSYTDALDVLGRLQLEQGDLPTAAETCRRAAEVTRGSIVRLQRHGLLAFYAGQPEVADKPLERAAVLGCGSPMFDPQVLAVSASLRFRQRDARGLQRALDALADLAAKNPGTDRLARLSAVAAVYGLVFHRQHDAATDALRRLAGTLLDPSVDAESACNLLTLWATLAATADGAPPDVEAWVDTLATRFASSRTLTTLLAAAAAAHPPHAARVAAAQAEVASRSEAAVALALEGRPRDAVAALMAHAVATRNPKFADLARLTLRRHEARIDDAGALTVEVDRLVTTLAGASALPPLGQTPQRVPAAHPARPPAG